jgi:hypothetical protein
MMWKTGGSNRGEAVPGAWLQLIQSTTAFTRDCVGRLEVRRASVVDIPRRESFSSPTSAVLLASLGSRLW